MRAATIRKTLVAALSVVSSFEPIGKCPTRCYVGLLGLAGALFEARFGLPGSRTVRDALRNVKLEVVLPIS